MEKRIFEGTIPVAVSENTEDPHQADSIFIFSRMQRIVHGDNSGYTALLHKHLASLGSGP